MLRYYFGSPDEADTDRFLVTDDRGNRLPDLHLTYPFGYGPGMFFLSEGMTYIPASAGPELGDHIAASLISSVGLDTVVIGIFDMTGQMTHVIAFAPPELPDGSDAPLYNYLVSLAWSDGHFFVVTGTEFLDTVYSVDLDGTWSGPLRVFDEPEVESLTALPDGRFAYLDYWVGTLRFVDPGFAPLPGDRPWPLGTPDFGRPTNVLWNPDTNEFWTNANHDVKALTADLRPSRTVAPLSTMSLGATLGTGMSWDAGAHQLVYGNATSGNRRGVYLFDVNGQFSSRISMRGVTTDSLLQRPHWIAAAGGGEYAWIPAGPQPAPDHLFDFPPPPVPDTVVVVARSTGVPDPTTLGPKPSFMGEVVRTFTLAGDDRGPMQKIPLFGGAYVVGAGIFDTGGNRLARLDPHALGLADVSSLAYVESGPWAGKWVMADVNRSEVVIFDWAP